jgi:hypothetical protein
MNTPSLRILVRAGIGHGQVLRARDVFWLEPCEGALEARGRLRGGSGLPGCRTAAIAQTAVLGRVTPEAAVRRRRRAERRGLVPVVIVAVEHDVHLATGREAEVDAVEPVRAGPVPALHVHGPTG